MNLRKLVQESRTSQPEAEKQKKMSRRKFVQKSLAGIAGLSSMKATMRNPVTGAQTARASDRLFPTNLPELEWIEFKATGFTEPVCGLIHRASRPPCCGLPLGGISTGCLDIEVTGVLGFSTIFHSYPKKPQLLVPFLANAVGDKTWVLATKKLCDGGKIQGCTEPLAPGGDFRNFGEQASKWTVTLPKLNDIQAVKEIHYWGHFPVADVEYETDAPVNVGMRAWAPFIPGDIESSTIPGAIFELHLRNTSDSAQEGTLVFNFPGPTQDEAQFIEQAPRREIEIAGRRWFAPVTEGTPWNPVGTGTNANRKRIQGLVNGIWVYSKSGVGYCLGVIGKEKIRLGAGLGADDWSKIRTSLPPEREKDFSTSLAIDYRLNAGESKIFRIVLAWYAPLWQGWRENCYQHMYSTRFKDAVEVAELLAREHESLLRRVLAWQQVIYTDEDLPVWLRETLVNNLALIAETSYWAVAKEPLLDWAAPEGLFGLNESPRGSPQIECIPCSWYGNLPIVYFFPELAKSTLRGYKKYMRHDGAAPFIFGPGVEMAIPTWEWQKSLNGVCFVDMVDRLWMSTGDDNILQEFYQAVKRSTIFTMNLRPGPEGVISMPEGNLGREWWEGIDWFGMATHVGGMHLANLRIAERMARKMGDQDFAEQCQLWLQQGSKAMEEKMWNGQYYLLYNEPETGRKSDLIMANQLDGEWACRFHGLPGVFRKDRVKKTLETIKKTCLVDICGAVSFANPDGTPQLKSYGIFPPEIMILGMTYLYTGERETGIEIVHKNMYNMVCRHRHSWDLPNMIHADTGQRVFGTDYYQNMMLWAMPAAIAGQDLSGPCKPDGLIARVIEAGKIGKVK